MRFDTSFVAGQEGRVPTRRRRRRHDPDRVRRLYDRVAPDYAHYRTQWLALAGKGAERALHADLAAAVHPGARVLDAGCGTGAVSREIVHLYPAVTLTMIDLSPAMLREAADVPAPRVTGSVLELPFPDDHFDVILSAWVIETVPDPKRAVSEFLRVLAPGGRILYTFCSRPPRRLDRLRSLLLRTAVTTGFAGEFLRPAGTPWHDCPTSHRYRFSGGLTTEIALGKCCTVSDLDVPEAPPRRRRRAGTKARTTGVFRPYDDRLS